MAIVVRQ